MLAYRCKEGDMLDAICWHYYGREAGAVEQVLEANPHLADIGPMLPAGTLVTLPDIEAEQREEVGLW